MSGERATSLQHQGPLGDWCYRTNGLKPQSLHVAIDPGCIMLKPSSVAETHHSLIRQSAIISWCSKSLRGAFIAVEVRMPRKPISESSEERDERMKKEALRALDDAHAAEDEIDAMVKRSIRRYGP